MNGCDKVYPADLNKCPHCGIDAAFSSPEPIDPRDYGYDIETYPNIFTCRFTHINTGMKWKFEISDRINQTDEFVTFCMGLSQIKARGVGYNNEHFDYPVIHMILKNPMGMNAETIYTKSQAIFASNDMFEHAVWDNERYFEQIDLFKIHHFDNKAKRTSLKALEIAMRMDNIEDLPYAPGTHLNDHEKDVLLEYNDHDVEATCRLYARTVTMIKLRETLSEKFGKNFINKNDVKMGEMILVGELEKAGVMCFDQVGGRKVKRQTHRASINLNDCIFPYVKFERPEFEMIRAYLASKTITQTKGVFTDIECTPEMVRYMDADRVKVYGYKGEIVTTSKGVPVLKPYTSAKPVKLSKVVGDTSGCRFEAENLHCVINGFRFDFGTGGLHASVSSQIVVTDANGQVVDVDVASFYPWLGIANNLYPEHLSTVFGDAYRGVYETRKSYPKSAPENGAFKLALNGAYGGSNNEHSPFYDPKYTMTITINGQLLLCMLVEQMLKIPGLEMIQCNTDGITYKCPHGYIEHQRQIQKWWESNTCLELEEALYNRMFIRDVNSYIAEYDGGKLKRIGTYAHVTPDENPATREVAWHKDPSALIVPKVAERVLVEGADARELIKNWPNKYDFLIRAKVPRSNRLVMRWPEYDNAEIELQKTTRYFVSNTGGTMLKIAPPSGELGSWKRSPGVKDNFYMSVMRELNARPVHPPGTLFDSLGVPHDERIHTKGGSKHETRESNMCAGYRVTDCADIENFDMKSVNIDYYVNEVDKITKPLL